MAASAALVTAESLLALTPVVIKKTPLDPVSAIWSRTLSSTVLGYGLSGDRSLPQKEWTSAAALGGINLLHIASSYDSFRHLPAGQAMSLLYTYPLWNLVFGYLFNNEPIKKHEFGFMGLAVLGSVLLNQEPGLAAEGGVIKNPNPRWGVLMGLIMALTESGMHTILRRLNWKDAAKSVWVVNGSASAWLAAALGINEVLDDNDPPKITGSASDAFLLTAFNSVATFAGYWLRFFAVPRLSVVTYSILSYSGLLASYIFGKIFLGETPGWLSVLGALLILISGVLIQVYSSESVSG